MLVPSAAGYNWPSIFLFLLTTTLVYMVYNSLSHADLRQTREVLDLLREDEKKIRDLSFRDPLTGAWNRRFMDETLPHVCALATRDSRPISFIMTDLDHFKSINDRFGHPVGDLVLTGVSRAILECVRESDLVFRYGGDEFLIVLPESSREVALRCIERIQEAVHSVPLPPEMAAEPPIHLTCGLAIHSDGTADPRALVSEADREMYRVKNAK
jgi:diguanylate cyclase (GGDEF)-like protein